ncbi:PREDICTED: TM2 domain-containing protein almondex [Diuraphis noxia]|uniref:TM2 domain-containing protein almondex n=1 Tax=Diuraphis noxia TaxID=143948 RepID=UPI000763A680|nr:PREDICTED: TM2 domain-containing protein almondex [Diuraphis noxia]
MKSKYYQCAIIFLFQLTVSGIASQNDDDHIDLSLSKQKQKSIQTTNMNNSTHPRMIRHEDDLERIVSEHKACSSMPYSSISCHMNSTCVYGNQTIAICKSNVDCLGENTFAKNLTCRFCYQTEFWEYECVKKICNSAASPPTYYRFYLGHWQEGIGKLFSFGGLGVWTLIDVLLISIRYLGPADGSLYL